VIGLSLENAVARERLARHAITDSLTGTHNRRFLQPHSHQPLSQWFGKDTPVACLYFDIDDFRAMSERLGSDGGDDLLSEIASVARSCARLRDPLIRMGEDEFVLLLPGCDREKAGEIAGRIVNGCAEIDMQGEKPSVSMGVSLSAAEKDISVKQLVEQADQAMYVAKALDGSRFEFADDNQGGA